MCRNTSAVLPQTTLLGVTVLTSMNRSNLNDIGVLSSTEEQVCRLAHLAVNAGVGRYSLLPTRTEFASAKYLAILVL